VLFPCRKRDAAERKEGASRGKRRKKAGQNRGEEEGRKNLKKIKIVLAKSKNMCYYL
jgi:hypothetical protein